MRLTVLSGVLLLLCTTGLGADTHPRQPGVDAQHYAFRLTLLTSDSNDIQGEAAVTLRIAAGRREVFLDFTSGTPDGKGMTVTGVRLAPASGGTVVFEHANNRLRLPVPGAPVAADDRPSRRQGDR